MSTAAYGDGVAAERPDAGVVSEFATAWWIYLIAGILWCVAALVVLQFDGASVTTVGILVGVMFMLAGFQQLALAGAVDSMRWLFYAFGALFVVAGLLAMVRPVNTFVGLADMLGFLFVMFGVWWTIEPFLLRQAGSPLWWFGFITGPLMIVMGFWTSGQFFFHKAYILLVFVGIWALCRGITDIIRAFQVRSPRGAV